MEQKDGVEILAAPNRLAWREWLTEYHGAKKAVWLIIYKKENGSRGFDYAEAVQEALCFGWIDSKANKKDEKSFYLFFAKRNPKSKWSKVNKERVALAAGMKMIEIAQQSSTWTALETVDNLDIPADLHNLLAQNPIAFTNWEKFAPSARKNILQWILSAKCPETREKRIQYTVTLAAQNLKAK